MITHLTTPFALETIQEPYKLLVEDQSPSEIERSQWQQLMCGTLYHILSATHCLENSFDDP